jgi:hypothetical protein
MGVVAYPNPFNDQVTFKLNFDEKSPVNLEVFDLTGRVVYSSGQKVMNPGPQKLVWNVQDTPPGIYTYRIKAGNTLITNKLVRVN